MTYSEMLRMEPDKSGPREATPEELRAAHLEAVDWAEETLMCEDCHGAGKTRGHLCEPCCGTGILPATHEERAARNFAIATQLVEQAIELIDRSRYAHYATMLTMHHMSMEAYIELERTRIRK